MITIALDEGEHFENPRGCMFVGGIVFKHRSYSEMENERVRLKKLFTTTCAQLGCNYPEDLHFNWVGNSVVNFENANNVKMALEKKMPDFIQGKGEWSCEPPYGEYRLFVLLGDRNGIASFCTPGISNLIDDNVACNRYEHMAYRTIENLLFYNSHYVDNEIKLELATRVIKPQITSQLSDDVKKLGFSKSDPRINDNRYKVTDSGSFRAALASAIQDSSRDDIQFDINVQSINYSIDALRNNIDLYQSFLYLSDTICSIYSNNIHTIRNCQEALEKLERVCKNITGRKNYLWAYDEIDQIYRKAYADITHGNYYEALYILYDSVAKRTNLAQLYDELWFKPLLQSVMRNSNSFAWRKAVEKLESYLYTPNYDVSKAEYIYSVLRQMSELDSNTYQSYLFYLYKVEMMLFNHKGDYLNAENASEKCIQYSNYVPIEEYLELRNMISVLLLDKGNYEYAVEFTKETVSYEEMLVDLRKEMYPNSPDVYIRYGRSLSQLGQCYSFMGDYSQADESFLKALDLFGEDKTDYQITLSYYLHELIEKKDQEKYEQYAKIYFNEGDLKKQFRRLFELDSTTLRYALFVYLKAFFIFYRDQVQRNFIREVIDKSLNEYRKSNGGHPWELILKYVAFLVVTQSIDCHDPEKIMASAEEAVAPATGRIQKIVNSGKEEFERVKEGNVIYCENDKYMFR